MCVAPAYTRPVGLSVRTTIAGLRCASALLASIGVAGWATSAAACSYESFAAEDRLQREYLVQVSSVYDGVITDMVGQRDDPVVSFTVRKTRDVWGSPGPEQWSLSYELGACVNYFFLLEDYPEGQEPGNGMHVRVFLAPEAYSQPGLLFVTPIGRTTDVVTDRWRAANRQRTQ